MNDTTPRPEYPRPQFVREKWLNLNGQWTCEFDVANSGYERGNPHSNGFKQRIMVPFCPESDLSGIGHKDFINCLWYHRKFSIPSDWQEELILLHFGAVDYECELFINGSSVGKHYGGSSSFAFNIKPYIRNRDDNDLVLWVKDDVRSGLQSGGKQSPWFHSKGCHYTRVTGIWQTVWLEPVSGIGLKDITIIPDVDNSTFVITPVFWGIQGQNLTIAVKEGNKIVARVSGSAQNGIPIAVAIPEAKKWSTGSPFLYNIDLNVKTNSGTVDQVASYAGLRKIHIEGNKLFLNNEELYLRMVLDQGFYPDGIWTAPSDEALKNDILLSMKAGFNSARLHQKVFEPRFHYWADKLGYLTWGEAASWGVATCYNQGHSQVDSASRNFICEWREVVCRDRNHPSIIAWTPLNETHAKVDWNVLKRFETELYELTKSLDPTRPVNDSSGYCHAKTDLWTVHNYTQDGAKLRNELFDDNTQMLMRNFPDIEPDYEGQPYIVDEFGGIKWVPRQEQEFSERSWGYGDAPTSLEKFYDRLKAQVDAICSLKEHICGYCYTQLTDVEQEQNGIYNYDRTEKFDMEKISSIFQAK